MFGRLMPREGRFFDYFVEHGEQLVLGARELQALQAASMVESGLVTTVFDEIRAAEQYPSQPTEQAHTEFQDAADEGVR